MKTLTFSYLFSRILSSACLGVDTSDTIYLFGTPKGDFSIGTATQQQWFLLPSSAERPDFASSSPSQCHFAQYSNAMVILNANSASSMVISTFFYSNNSWSKTQAEGSADPKQMKTIYDHDTNVLYGLYKGAMYYLRMEGTPSTSAFVMSGNSPLSSAYSDAATVGFGQNHIYYLNAPGFQPGQAQIFIIHYNYWQPALQSYTPAFPSSGGQTVSIPLSSFSVPLVFAFIPDDGSGTYLINVDLEQNTTVKYPPPPVKDPEAQYTASSTTLVQLTSSYLINTLDITKPSSQWVQMTSSVLDSLKGISIQTGSGTTSDVVIGSGSGQTGSSSSPQKNSAIGGGFLEVLYIAILSVLTRILIEPMLQI